MINTVRYMKLTNLASAIGGLALVAVLAACSSSTSGKADPKTPAGPPTTNTQQTEATGGEDHPDSGGATGNANSGCQPDVVVQFCETIDITGAATVSGTAVAIPDLDQGGGLDLTCATWVNHKPDNSDYPQFKVPNDAVDGHKLETQWGMPYQAGTAKFGATTAPSDPSYGYALSGNLTIDSKNYVVITHGTDVQSSATASYDINPDGSGKLTFDKLLAGEGTSASDAISGSISWTCVDPES
jgi:hypothetical protein